MASDNKDTSIEEEDEEEKVGINQEEEDAKPFKDII